MHLNTSAAPARAAAPGKVVISGAYVVLEGAPAIVTAVNRYVIADAGRPASYLSPEVTCALEVAPYVGYAAPDYDVSALREEDRKLGLGSSAAILLASLAALPPSDTSSAEGLQALFEHALLAHRRAQGGGSGIDVAASTFGGSLRFQFGPGSDDLPRVTQLNLPPGLHVEVWSSDRAAKTSEFLKNVRAARARAPERVAEIYSALRSASEEACRACEHADAQAFVSALKAQAAGLCALGRAASIPIVTTELAELTRLSEDDGAALLPAGAGGGDIALWVSTEKPSTKVRFAQQALAHGTLALEMGAKGVHRL
ncbi:MAG: hypothetical protein RJA70_1983 [Pseudomonadota bacterium]|jgi:phosphomevalonate kinase